HDFFLNEKAGYCFWFASATTLALRANGIPSKLVSGYMVHERLSSQLWLVHNITPMATPKMRNEMMSSRVHVRMRCKRVE
ncbi:MAG TPA: transglutaminase domain-containing protein, partial [Myxococcales bacterium]|nr:transglutaminase domain-containing protein [Myxococcales bacterium]